MPFRADRGLSIRGVSELITFSPGIICISSVFGLVAILPFVYLKDEYSKKDDIGRDSQTSIQLLKGKIVKTKSITSEDNKMLGWNFQTIIHRSGIALSNPLCFFQTAGNFMSNTSYHLNLLLIRVQMTGIGSLEEMAQFAQIWKKVLGA